MTVTNGTNPKNNTGATAYARHNTKRQAKKIRSSRYGSNLEGSHLVAMVRRRDVGKKLPQINQNNYLFACIDDEPDRVIINNCGKKKYTVKQFHNYKSIFCTEFFRG